LSEKKNYFYPQLRVTHIKSVENFRTSTCPRMNGAVREIDRPPALVPT
jgi:hypothetical protein